MSEEVRPEDRAMRIGRAYVFEYATRADGSQPAREFLQMLKSGNLPGDPDSRQSPPDPDQVSDYTWFLNEIGRIARDAEPSRRHSVNYLHDGIWELKHGAKRLTFYDTDGAGSYVEKPPVSDPADSPDPSSPLWFFPNFDSRIRLGHWFFKQGERTTPADLQTADDVRREDLERDRTIQ